MQALSMMVVASGNCCDLLQSCSHAPTFRVSPSYEALKESRRSKGWCMSLVKNQYLRFPGQTGTKISHKKLLTFLPLGCTPCIIGSCSRVTGPELGTPIRKALVTVNSRGKLGKRNQVRIERSLVRCYGKGASGEIYKDSGSGVCGAKQSEPIKRTVPLKDGWVLGTGEVREQGSSGLFNQPHRLLESEISNSEYEKIQDLKFSGDMWEDDSGPQVLDLQRALYYFGYLPKRTELTAYFGPETKRALQRFQIAYGVPGTGAWGSSSRQALWKLFSEESSSFSVEGGSSVHSDMQQLVSTSVNKVNVGGTDVGIRVSELVNNMGAHGQEFMSTISSAPCWRHLPTNVPRNAAMFGLLVGMLAALFSFGYSVVEMLHDQHGQPVRRRVLRAHWRDDLSGTVSAKPKRHLDMFPGLDLSVVREEDFKYRLRSKSRPTPTNGTGRTDRLILYGGQVLVGDEVSGPVYPFMNGPGSRRGSGNASQDPSRSRVSSTHVQASTDQVIQNPASNGSLTGPREDLFQGSQVSPKRMSNVRIRRENQSILRPDSDAVGSTLSRPNQSLVPMEQPIERQPNFLRSLLSAWFTPKGLGNSAGLGQQERHRIYTASTQSDPRSNEKQVLVNSETESRISRMERHSKSGGNDWQDKDEENSRDRVEELRRAVQATEKNRQAAMRALAEERQRSLELQVKISRQKETAAALEEEVRVLKESHDTLLASLRKKYSSSVAARAAAALLYQNWDTNYEEGSPQTLSY